MAFIQEIPRFVTEPTEAEDPTYKVRLCFTLKDVLPITKDINTPNTLIKKWELNSLIIDIP